MTTQDLLKENATADSFRQAFDDLKARVEAAEAEVARLRDENHEAWFAFDRQQDRANRAATRPPGLEAALASGRIAGHWRPGSNPPAESGVYLTFETGPKQRPSIQCRTWTARGWWRAKTKKVLFWMPIPPLPQEPMP